MKLVLIIGAPASGKMTVGQELAKLAGLHLFHNHMSLELVNQFFDFGTKAFSRLDKSIRFAIFKEVAKSQLEGLIFTLVWDFDCEKDEAYVDEIIQIFRRQDARICLVELQADLEERLKRNQHEHRLLHKPSKRDLERSENYVRYAESNFRMRSRTDEFPDKPIFQIDNTQLSPHEVARIIKEKFEL